MEDKEFRVRSRFVRRAAREVARMAIDSIDATTRPFAEQMVENNRSKNVIFSDYDLRDNQLRAATSDLNIRRQPPQSSEEEVVITQATAETDIPDETCSK